MMALNSLATELGNRLQSAAYGLETLGNLLGADGSEHLLSDADMSGLAHAVCALAGYVQAAGLELFEAAEMESEQ
ncbi:hypothetical protein NA643_15345 [Pseudomonas stutzeri]|uniref:hypothetical protein n=1 Tax=Stutzerimonas stutzeri TaxID=316 RepID=UPI000C9C5240|nr:hypothetical protein [Stutzerimonas stutzeri]MCQ4280468.1 hypothetical protein [Stutzerimonas stutzeri]PNF71509.1 hypothetical protein CXK96_16865 [Stutzerimonas stutzeri]